MYTLLTKAFLAPIHTGLSDVRALEATSFTINSLHPHCLCSSQPTHGDDFFLAACTCVAVKSLAQHIVVYKFRPAYSQTGMHNTAHGNAKNLYFKLAIF